MPPLPELHDEEEEEALHNAALLDKLQKLRLFREELERKSKALQALEHEKEEREALLGPLLQQVEELKTLAARQREQIEEAHAQAEAAHAEEVATRAEVIETEVAQLQMEVRRQKELGQALASVRKDYRRCQEHAEGFLTTLVRLSRRPNEGSAAEGEVALQVEQRALLETFFPPELGPPTSTATPQKKASRAGGKHLAERPLWSCLRSLVEEVVGLLTDLKKAQSQRQRFLERLARAEMERDALTVRAEAAVQELEETRSVAETLETVARNLRDSLEDLESTRSELQAELLARDEFLLSLAERMKALSAIERDEAEMAKEGGQSPSPRRRRPTNFASSTSSMDSFVAVQSDIHAYLNHLLEKLKGMQVYYTQATQHSHQREADLTTLTRSLVEISEKNDEMAVAVDLHRKQATEAKHLCAEQQEHLQVLVDSLRESEQTAQAQAGDIEALQEENERMKAELRQLQAEREQERRAQETEKGEVAAWKRHATKLQQEVTELREKSKIFWLSSPSSMGGHPSQPAASAFLMSNGMGSSSAGHSRHFG